MGFNVKSFATQCGRVWSLLKKPSMYEFKNISMVSAIGLGIIGVLGFLIAIAMNFIYPQ